MIFCRNHYSTACISDTLPGTMIYMMPFSHINSMMTDMLPSRNSVVVQMLEIPGMTANLSLSFYTQTIVIMSNYSNHQLHIMLTTWLMRWWWIWWYFRKLNSHSIVLRLLQLIISITYVIRFHSNRFHSCLCLCPPIWLGTPVHIMHHCWRIPMPDTSGNTFAVSHLVLYPYLLEYIDCNKIKDKFNDPIFRIRHTWASMSASIGYKPM